MKIISTTLPPPDSLLQQASMSDLFFNYDHPEDYRFNAGRDGDGLSDDDYNTARRAALMLDAEGFAETLRNATGIDVIPSELVEDYLARE